MKRYVEYAALAYMVVVAAVGMVAMWPAVTVLRLLEAMPEDEQ